MWDITWDGIKEITQDRKRREKMLIDEELQLLTMIL